MTTTHEEASESDWIIYLKESGNYESYDGMCDCYQCKKVVRDFETWKYERERAAIDNAIEKENNPNRTRKD